MALGGRGLEAREGVLLRQLSRWELMNVDETSLPHTGQETGMRGQNKFNC